MRHESILSTLQALECELHEPSARRDHQHLSELLHPEFQEFGLSGAIYTKASILEHLATESASTQIHAQDFSVQELGASVFLLTYKSATIAASGVLERHANRSSVWMHGPSGWQVIFHQGTATAAFVRRAT